MAHQRRARAALFDGAMSSPGGLDPGAGGMGFQVVVEEKGPDEIDRGVDALARQVGRLKEITHQVSDQVGVRSALLEQMEGAVQQARSMLRATSKRVDRALRQRQGAHLWVLLAFMLLAFCAVYVASKVLHLFGRSSRK